MSFDIDWESVTADNRFNQWLYDFLNERLSSIELPEHLSDLKVDRCSLGNKSPEIIIRDISAPFPEFYPEDQVENETQWANGVNNQQHHNHNHNHSSPFQENGTVRNGRSTKPSDLTPSEFIKSNGSPLGTSTSPSKHNSPFLEKDRSELSLSGTPFLHTRFGALDISRSPSPMSNVLPVGLYQQPFPSPLKMKQNNNSQHNTGYFPNVNGVGIGGLGSSYRPSNGSSNKELNNNADSNEDYGSSIELGSHLMNPANISIDGTNETSIRIKQNRQKVIEEAEEKEKLRLLEQKRQLDYNERQIKLQKRANDVQLSIEVKFDSDIYIEVTCNLLLNYPSNDFIKLPIRLKITDLFIHSLGIITYIDKKVYLSFLCDINDNEINGREDSRQLSTSGGMNPPEFISSKNKERIDIIKRLRIQGELGSNSDDDYDGNNTTYGENFDIRNIPSSSPLSTDSPSSHSQSNFIDSYNNYGTHTNTNNGSSSGSVLRNIGKIEKFLLARLRELMISELAWPNWIELDFNEDDESEEEDGEEDGEEEEEETEEKGKGEDSHESGEINENNDKNELNEDEISSNNTPINLTPIETITPQRNNNGLGITQN